MPASYAATLGIALADRTRASVSQTHSATEQTEVELSTGRTTELAAAGGIALIGGRVFLSTPIERSFALVRVPDLAGVQTSLENHPVGPTDDRGDVLIPNLQLYYGNNISIDAGDLPIDRQLPETHRVIAPPFGGGVVISFAAAKLHLVRGAVQIDRDGRSPRLRMASSRSRAARRRSARRWMLTASSSSTGSVPARTRQPSNGRAARARSSSSCRSTTIRSSISVCYAARLGDRRGWHGDVRTRAPGRRRIDRGADLR